MEAYETDEQQIEAIKKWWQENYKTLIFLAVIAIAAVLGTQYYQENKQLQAQAASNNFNEVLNALQQNQNEIVLGRTQLLKDESKDSPYTALAAILTAKTLLADKKIDQAIEQLVWAYDNTDDSSLKQISLIRKFKLMMEKNQLEPVLNELQAYMQTEDNDKKTINKTFMPLLLETKGDVLVALDRKQEAKKAYDDAMSGLLIVGGNTEIIRIKRNDLGN